MLLNRLINTNVVTSIHRHDHMEEKLNNLDKIVAFDNHRQTPTHRTLSKIANDNLT